MAQNDNIYGLFDFMGQIGHYLVILGIKFEKNDSQNVSTNSSKDSKWASLHPLPESIIKFDLYYM